MHMKYVIGVIGAVVIAVLAILIILLRVPADKSNQPVQKDGKKLVQVSDYAKDNATVVYTMQGHLVGETERRAVRISVNSNERRIEILKGYNETTDKSETYPNTKAGYETFLKALDNSGFSRERPYDPKDERGICPLGNLFIYEIKKSGDGVTRLWSTSCNTKQGTLAGSASAIRQLFQNQVPEYGKFTTGVALQ